jgi:hypothetical protein
VERVGMPRLGQYNGRIAIENRWLSLVDDVARLHVEIDNLNDSIVGFCFIRSIDMSSSFALILMQINFSFSEKWA